MNKEKRKLELDIFDHKHNKLCNVYTSDSDIPGQASNVVITTERNGWKELSFTVPSVCFDGEDNTDNYRLSYLKNEYLIRSIDDNETDWFLISEPKIQHSNFSKNITVTAGHIAQMLKHKKLDLVFSKDEGNNTATAAEFLDTILENTGWRPGYVATFYEKDGRTIKYRTLDAGEKSGAFKLISDVCKLFDAKPIYHGDTKTVDIIPMNPFSEPKDGGQPDLSNADDIIEVHYGKNMSGISKNTNSENLVTKLYAYGAYGDKTYGYCSIQECEHAEFIYTVSKEYDVGSYYIDSYSIKGNAKRYKFNAKQPIHKNDKLIISMLDPASCSYIWNDTQNIAYLATSADFEDDSARSEFMVRVETGSNKWNVVPYHAKDPENAEGIPFHVNNAINSEHIKIEATETMVKVKNWFNYLLDFDYYISIGLINDDTIQKIAKFQRTASSKYENTQEANAEMLKQEMLLSEIIGQIKFAKLRVSNIETVNGGYITLNLNRNWNYYRTDYDKKEINQFRIYGCESYDSNGDPIPGAFDQDPAIVYVIHNTNPVTWDKAYVRNANDEKNPTRIEINATSSQISVNAITDRFYIMPVNNINGYLGALEATDEAAVMALDRETTIVTQTHPTYYTSVMPTLDVVTANEYGWWYNNNTGVLYFYNSIIGTTEWTKVFVTRTGFETIPLSYSYAYDTTHAMLYKRVDGLWTPLDDDAISKSTREFGTVYMLCTQRDRLYKGVEKNNVYEVDIVGGLPIGDYYMYTGYDQYQVFSTKEIYPKGTLLNYMTGNGYTTSWIEVKKPDGTTDSLLAKSYGVDSVFYSENDFENRVRNKVLFDETLFFKAGQAYIGMDALIFTVSGKEALEPGNYYLKTDREYILFTTTKTFTYMTTFVLEDGSNTGTFTDPYGNKTNVYVIRVSDRDVELVSEEDVDNKEDHSIYISDIPYFELYPIRNYETDPTDHETHGIISYMQKFAELADKVYIDFKGIVDYAKNEISVAESEMIDALGDMYREGYWQDTNYIDGDEERLYDDAVDNLVEISKPEENYTINFVETFGTDRNITAYGDNPFKGVFEQDMTIMSAVHLIDEDIGVNKWAYVEKISKCYDKPWQTTIAINTKLSDVTQHSFTDVMSSIAEIASTYKGRSTIYGNTPNSTYLDGLMIDGSQILNGTIGGLQLANASIDDAKIAGLSANKIRAGTIDASEVRIRNLDADSITVGQIKRKQIAEGAIDFSNLSNPLISTIESASEAADKVLTAYTNGELGAGIDYIENYYVVSDNKDVAPVEGWSTTVITTTPELRYLWNFERIHQTNNTYKDTIPRIISVHGATGSDGRSITNVIDYYLATDKKEGVTNMSGNWTVAVQEVSEKTPYLWNYEVVTYSEGESTRTEACLIGIYGKGRDAITVCVDSSDGVVFLNTEGQTTLTVTVNYGGKILANLADIMNTFDVTHYLKWYEKVGDKNYAPVSLDDLRLSNNGFTFIISATDIYDVNVYKVELNNAEETLGVAQITLADVTDSYTVYLSSEAYSFTGDAEGAKSGACSTDVALLQGTTPRTLTVASVDCPDGISSTVRYNSDETKATVIFTIDQGAVISDTCEATIHIEKRYFEDTLHFTKRFTIAVSKSGKDGEDGKILYTWIKYADTPTSGMSDNPEGKEYIGFAYNKETIIESTNYNDYTWSLVKGLDGQNGDTYYTWIKYADDASGSNMSASPSGKEYIGIAYNKLTSAMSDNPADYTWSLFKGSDGINGINGTTFYTWIKYADDKYGLNMSDNPDGKDYIGIAYNRTSRTESTTASDYSWSKIQGEDGKDGTGVTILGTYVSLDALKLEHPVGNIGDSYIINGNLYVWSDTENNWIDVGRIQGPPGEDGKTPSITATRNGDIVTIKANGVTIATIKDGEDGEDGQQGPKGDSGESTYVHFAYANSADGSSGFSKTVSANKSYIGQYVDSIKEDSNDYTKYKWTLIKGSKGDTGDTYFTWIRYADTITGSGISSNPEGKEFIGIAYNKLSNVSTNNPADYTWAKFRGDQGIQGDQGPKGDATVILQTVTKYKYSDSMQTAPSTEDESTWYNTAFDASIENFQEGCLWTWNRMYYSDGTISSMMFVSKDGKDFNADSVSFNFDDVKKLVAAAIDITQGDADSVIINNLAPNNAAMMANMLGEFCFRYCPPGLIHTYANYKFYYLTTTSNGIIRVVEVQVSADENKNNRDKNGRTIIDWDNETNPTALTGNELNFRKADIEQIFANKIQSGEITAAQGMMLSATIPELYAETIKAISDSITFEIAGKAESLKGVIENVFRWFIFGEDGFTVKKSTSSYSTLTDESGFHIKNTALPEAIGSFSRGKLSARQIMPGSASSDNIVVRETATGGWVWTDAIPEE